jgi:hypothetical protein
MLRRDFLRLTAGVTRNGGFDTPRMPALTNNIEPLIAYLKNPQMNDVADPKVSDFIPAVFYDASVYNPKKPSVHYPGSSSQVDVAEIEKSKDFMAYRFRNLLVPGFPAAAAA